MDTPQPKTYNIQELYEWYVRKELVLAPKFQRRDVWTVKPQSYLIDTILREMPIPKVFMRQTIDVAKKKSVKEVVDGQQRFRAIFGFIDNKIRVMKSHNPEFGGCAFADLPQQVQLKFLSYMISADVLVGASDQDVLEVFSRINSFGAPLNTQELLNAEFYGLFKQTVHQLGRDHLEFWTNNGLLTNHQIARMQEVDLVTQLVAVMISRNLSRLTASQVKGLYEKYDDDFPEKERIMSGFREIMGQIAFLFPEGLRGTPYGERTVFYSLFVLLFSFREPLQGVARHKIDISARTGRAIRTALDEASNAIRHIRDLTEYAEYVDAFTHHTTDFRSKKLRHEFLLEFIRES